ncbi:CehA/McbA family metallohydrolase [Marinobacter xestospongiae]|uniref:CehA/McbA family metallohydrolase n=1 Tax=Marinobacter xestospongiae TaxID=994319 RepID=UPI00200323CB|nr:CehA/McbA family metallohydrolase [Marinobacter xestospongiae]MCK7567972.1 CehA/McbA family metallohydrolase [Marinobacter xestospongiae]
MQTAFKSTARTLSVTLGLSLAGCQTLAGVSVERGPTPLRSGDATASTDIQLRNDHLVASIAVDSAPPWGVAPGGIIDAAPVHNGEPARDKVSLIDFIPNNWSSWPTTYQEFTIVEDGPERGVVEVRRDWEGVQLTTTYTLAAGSDRIHVVTEMANDGDKAYDDILSGYVMWPDGGHLFGPAGMHGAEEGPTDQAFADWSAAYDEDWGFVLHAPYMSHIDYDARDLYLQHDLAPGASRTFEGWVQVLPDGSIARAVAAEVERKALPAGQVSGQVETASGDPVTTPVIVVERDGQPYAWALGDQGRYQLQLPVGDYQLYATARSHADSTPVAITVTADGRQQVDFNDVQAPGKVRFQVQDSASGEPRDARLTIREGQMPLVGFLGKTTYFTELNEVGQREVAIAPGDYVFEVAHGENFLSQATRAQVQVSSGETAKEVVDIHQNTAPNRRDWYSADMHHHSDVLDGFTPPEYAIRSELSAGLDLVLLLDHDTTRNLAEAARLTAARGVPFIPSIEISASWGHFNPYPIDPNADYQINSGEAPIQDIIAQRDALGADAIQVNHPYIKYGYYTNLENGTATGGYFPRFDLMEINAEGEYEKTLRKAWDHWSHGERVYLSAGSDVHDVWQHRSGSVRAYAQVAGEVSAESFVASLRDGHAFVTFGPLVYPDHLFGEDLTYPEGEQTTLGFDLAAANGLATIQLIGDGGQVVAEREFDDAPTQARAEFDITVDGDTFYAVVVEDSEGKQAFSNPIWIDAMSHRPAPEADGE